MSSPANKTAKAAERRPGRLAHPMPVRNLYLSIYLTVVAVLLVFALVAGALVRRHADAERGRIEVAVSERTAAWAELLEHSLPPAGADDTLQGAALLDWSRRLRIAIALDARDGHRVATSELYADVEAHEGALVARPTRVQLSDGRALWLVRPRQRTRPSFADDRVDVPTSRPALAETNVDSADAGETGAPAILAAITLRLEDWLGRLYELVLPGQAPHLRDEGTRLVGLMMVLFVAIAGGSYPVVRRLTRRLEALQRGVETFGAGNLGHRVSEAGQDEVAAVASSFNRAADRVEALVRANRSLLANASHELRSPLARMKMALAMYESVPDQQRDRLKAEIERDIRELDALVEEVLLASRLDAQSNIAHDRVDLLDLAADEAGRIGASAELDVAAGGSASLRGDERLLRRALRNLLENARRYGGGEVLLRMVPLGAGAWRVEVCDRGPGVPDSERERIFEPFYRLPGHSETAGGVGLGLSLVKQIAARHGGQVGCEARAGGGSCFFLELPGSATTSDVEGGNAKADAERLASSLS
jgi:signal transduction histidine kinase